VAREDLPAGVVTLVFTDIEGSTRLLEDLGDRYAGVLADHRQLLRSAFATGGGVEVDTQGDAFFFAFPGGRGTLEAVAEAQRASPLMPGPTPASYACAWVCIQGSRCVRPRAMSAWRCIRVLA
jgi:class 3 adenylate cyclase